MSVDPVFPQPTRVRSDAAPTAAPERRNSDVTRDHFAASLATARTDRTACSERSPVRSDRATLAHAAPDSEEYTAAKARLVTQQRAQVSALMLSGAMKFAVTRNDASTSAVLPDAVASQPDMIAIPTIDDVAIDESTMLTTPMSDADIATSTVPTVMPAPDMLVALQITAAPLAMPEITTITNAESTNERTVSATADAGIDLTAATVATAAALQLIATLPIATLPIDIATRAPDAAATASAHEPAVDGDDAARSLASVVTSLPERVDTTLVEDHFDAPASALDAIAQSAPAAVPVAPTGTYAAPDTSAMQPADISAATSRAASSFPDISSLQTDLAKLDPEFRDRLQKVIDRMRTEHGHAVTVVETVRSQSRQDALFAQGRTAPGPVVTWTTNSKHGKGLAADLMVDGAWQNPVGYAHLAAVATQEGLRTLGSRDPGHVELPSDARVSGETLGNLLSDLAGDAGDAARQMRADVNTGTRGESRAALMNRVANVAQVARVATVASVAQVARVASVARPGSASQPAASEAISPLAVSGVPSLALASDAATVMRVATPVSGVNMSDRISHLLDLQATQDAKPLNSVLLRMDNANGIEDQIRIDTRGTSVDARLGLGNAQQAAALTDRLGELRDALERRGLTADGVRVQAASSGRGIDTASFTRPTAPVIELAAMRAAADSQAQGNPREQSTRDQAQREAFARDQSRHSPRPSTDDARQRSRREQPEERR